MNDSGLRHYSRTPIDLDIGRSVFSRPKRHLTTFDAGKLIPVLLEEVLPGDSVKLELSQLVRMATPIHPVMDNAFLDVHFYFVPNRLVWSNWKYFMGENPSSPWAGSMNYSIPQLKAPTTYVTVPSDYPSDAEKAGFAIGSVADYFGVPTHKVYLEAKDGNHILTVSALPFRAYGLIWNNYYRDQNTMSPCSVPLTDTTVVGTNAGISYIRDGINPNGDFYKYNSYCGSSYVTSGCKGDAPLPVCKLHDRFTSCLPAPQKGPSVLLPLGISAPVTNGGTAFFSPEWYKYYNNAYVDLSVGDKYFLGTMGYSGSHSDTLAGSDDGSDDLTSSKPTLYTALQADLSQATAASVNQLRQAFMVQRFYERLARGGSRYFEMIKAFFGVTVPDATVQIPEFLGGRRVPINITQVAQTSSTDTITPQGNVSAYSLTTDKSGVIFSKSFTEHGYLIGVAMVRAEHSYCQGIPRHFMRKVWSDFYVPTFANAPEQPVYKYELNVTGTSADTEVFGYQEAWDEYRSSPSQITGQFRTDYPLTLSSYHYGDHYTGAQTLSANWMREPQNQIQNTLAVNQVQFLADFLFDMTWVRAMPVYSVPGLLDHH